MPSWWPAGPGEPPARGAFAPQREVPGACQACATHGSHTRSASCPLTGDPAPPAPLQPGSPFRRLFVSPHQGFGMPVPCHALVRRCISLERLPPAAAGVRPGEIPPSLAQEVQGEMGQRCCRAAAWGAALAIPNGLVCKHCHFL